MATRFADHLTTGDHASRPAAGTLPAGSLYSCTTHGLVYQSDGVSTWATWATVSPSGGGYTPGGTDVAVADGGTGASTASGARTNLGLVIGTDIDARVMTTQDDIIIGGASGVATRLAKGSDGQVLTVDPTTHHLVWATPSGGGGGLAPFKRATSTAAGANQNSTTSFADLFTSQLSLSIPAAVDDIVKMELTVMTNDSDGQKVYADFKVNGTRIGDTTNGSYTHHTADNETYSHTVIVWRKVVSGDLASGSFDVVPQVKNETGTKPAWFYNTPPAVFVITNLGPAS